MRCKPTKPKYILPTPTFKFKIKERFIWLSTPKEIQKDSNCNENWPPLTRFGVRSSALKARHKPRIDEAAWPSTVKLIALKKMYKNKFAPERLEKINRMIEASNATMYAKLANRVIDMKAKNKDLNKRRRSWNESDWKKHMEYINPLSNPRRKFDPPPVDRGTPVSLAALMNRLNELSSVSPFKMYRRPSQQPWYRDPVKVPKGALTYQISDRVRVLAKPRKREP